MTMLEAAKGYFGVMVAKYNVKMNNLLHSEDTITNRVIGFSIEEDEENEEIL